MVTSDVHMQIIRAPHLCGPASLVLACLRVCRTLLFAMYAQQHCALMACLRVCRTLLFAMYAQQHCALTATAGTFRTPAEEWDMGAPAACLLLSKFAPATARLFAEFRRLRDSLPPAEARNFAECERKGLQHAEMVTLVRLCARQVRRA